MTTLRREVRCLARQRCVYVSSTSSNSRTKKISRQNWLEENCGDVPTKPREQDEEISEMLRGGYAIQKANAVFLNAKLESALRGPSTVLSKSNIETLELLKDVEDRAVESIQQAVDKENHRFRPSFLLPLIKCSSHMLGSFVSLFSPRVNLSYITGNKVAVAEYYNDQIREVYARKNEDQRELKELFKAIRDEELEYVDIHAPEIMDPTVEDRDEVRKVAKYAAKSLAQIAKTI